MNIYLYFPNNIEKIVDSKNDIQVFINNLKVLLWRNLCEKDTQTFYNVVNIDVFFKTIDTLSDLSNYGTISEETLIRQILLNDLEANKLEYKNNQKSIYKIWNFDNESLEVDGETANFDFFKSITDAILSEQKKFVLLNIGGEIKNSRNLLTILKDNKDNYKEEKLPQIARLFFLNNFEELEKWFEENRKPRKYNHNDNRHVVGHPDYRQGKSPIIGGQNGKAILASLLETALGCSNTDEFKDLINWDSENECYVWFEYEGENLQNQYHGYHFVTKNNHGEYIKNEKEEYKIPQEIKNVLKYRHKK